ncbi:MAG TPA: Mur ligase family protein [Candidatus Saccharimonadales bacterium]|nr:Mur ligase family protein [Candidatus Saccharimonadales bacterium]
MKFLKGLLSVYRPDFPKVVVYMLQSTEYDTADYLAWLWRVFDFGKVMHRRTLVPTKPARMLLLAMRLGILAQALLGVFLAYRSLHVHHSTVGLVISILFILSAPIVWAHLIVAPLIAGRWFITKPSNWRQIREAEKIFANHPGVRIAIAGSYGKTTMKEILLSVLSEGKKVAATPANRNVASSHAEFAASLKGDEEILLIEYGEGAPGDVRRFCVNTHPNMGIITGLAPAHLDKYKTLKSAGEDIFSLADYLNDQDVYVNGENDALKPFLKKGHVRYTSEKVDGWRVSDIRVSMQGTKFKMTKGSLVLNLSSALIGRHLVAPMALAAYLADEAGLTKQQIEKGVANIKPFEHRMQARELHGAWLIDDTYNGNIEGMEAGLKLLAELPAKRKVYVTPGLVDQGAETENIHIRLGRAIAAAKPDVVVLMKHSVTDYIEMGIRSADYAGQLIINDDPLDFYNNLDKFVAAGDLVLMQNDWPDNYA